MSGLRNRIEQRTHRTQQDGVVSEREEGTPREEDNLITFTPMAGSRGLQGNAQRQQPQEPKGQRTPRKRTREWELNQRHFHQTKPQEISHISPVEQGNVYNTEEPSVSYLQLPTRKATDNRLCSKCGNTGHWRRYCQASTWCRFCTSETHSTQACRKYTNFARDDPIASSRRTTPEQPPRTQPQQGIGIRQLFPQPPTQRFQAPVVPPKETRRIRYLLQRQSHIQRSSKDVRMDPHFRPPPPHYAQIQQHQQVQAPLVEINEMGPTIQQGVIQRSVRGAQSDKETRFQTQTRTVPQNRREDSGNLMSGPEESGGDRLPSHSGKSFPEGYQLSLNDVARPVFVNHYYAGEPLVPVMNKRYIRLDECDVSSESVVGIQQTQGLNREFTEHSRESLMVQHPTANISNTGASTSEYLQEHNNGVHSKFPEQSQYKEQVIIHKTTEHIANTENLLDIHRVP